MLNHLRLKHEHEIEGTPEKQKSMKDFVQSPRSVPPRQIVANCMNNGHCQHVGQLP
jgi:hypothetical protein